MLTTLCLAPVLLAIAFSLWAFACHMRDLTALPVLPTKAGHERRPNRRAAMARACVAANAQMER